MTYQSGFRSGLFDERTVLVTGGGGGLGRCIAHELSHLGACVILAGRTMEKLERVAEEIEEDGGRVGGCYSAELRDENEVTSLAGRLAECHERLDGLVNSAGGQFPAQLADLSLNGWNAVLHNNLTSSFLVSREIYRHFLERTGGSIVNIGADYKRGMTGMGHNGAARAGLSNFTFTAASEWGHRGVRVNCVIPGFISSTGLDRYPQDAWDGIRNVVRNTPLNRFGTAAEISAAVVFLLSDMAAYITGTELVVDGGIRNGSGGFLVGPRAVANTRVFNGFHRDEPATLLRDGDG